MRRVHLVVRAGGGFRPFVAGLARRLGLGGMVRNDSGSVVIEVEGPRDAIDAFAGALTRDLPPLAVVDSVTTRELARRRGRLPHRGQRRGRGPPHVHPAGRGHQ